MLPDGCLTISLRITSKNTLRWRGTSSQGMRRMARHYGTVLWPWMSLGPLFYPEHKTAKQQSKQWLSKGTLPLEKTTVLASAKKFMLVIFFMPGGKSTARLLRGPSTASSTSRFSPHFYSIREGSSQRWLETGCCTKAIPIHYVSRPTLEFMNKN